MPLPRCAPRSCEMPAIHAMPAMRLMLAVLAALLLASPRAHAAGSSVSESVNELIREARAHEATHEDALAARRYTEALELDPTAEEAYLGLGELRARTGDAREAERVYSVALAHAPHVRRALVGRAHARRTLGLHDESEQDLEAYVMTEDDASALRELATWYGEDRRTAAALATWRKLLTLGARTGDGALAHEARTMVRALQILLGPIDPVVAPSLKADDPARRALAAIAKRTG
jgi:tetratricopeptide (TPR) repeat protein